MIEHILLVQSQHELKSSTLGNIKTCKGHDTVVSLSAGNDTGDDNAASRELKFSTTDIYYKRKLALHFAHLN